MSQSFSAPSDLTVTALLNKLVNIDDAGLYFEDSFTSWREHLLISAHRATLLTSLLTPEKPPHVAILLENIPEFSFLLAGCFLGNIIPVGLNLTRRGSALIADAHTADCQLIIAHDVTINYLGAEYNSATRTVNGIPVLNIDSPEWTTLITQFSTQSPVKNFPPTAPADLAMLIFTSGTSGNPKAVNCSHQKFAIAGTMLATRYELTRTDVAYIAMPMFHSNAIIAGWMVAVAATASIALRRKFSASQFFPDIRKYSATYANYVGKPLAYILATPAAPDDADNPLKVMYGNEGSAADIANFSNRFQVFVNDAFGSTEGGVAIMRTLETPKEALGPLVAPNAVINADTDKPCPPAEFDENGNLLNPEEAIGELVNLSGGGAFSGYYRNPAADAERLRGGIYRSGDLGYVDTAGFAYFAGRLGDWVRVDGENLSTGPIERILLRSPAIQLAAVYGIRADVGDTLLAALVLRPELPTFNAEEFVNFLHAQPDLGPKQWPTILRISADLPRTETFKILKRTLQNETIGSAITDVQWWQRVNNRYQRLLPSAIPYR